VEIEGLDFSKVHVLAGDLNQGELEAAMMFEEPLHGVAHATIEIACGLPHGTLDPLRDDPDRKAKLAVILAGRIPKKCLVFCVTVAHAERMAEIFERWIGDSAVTVSGKLGDEDRAIYLKQFATGSRRFLCNCMIATEGFDEPSIEMVVMARPTKSRSLYAQMLGRGTRPAGNIAHRLGELATAEERVEMIANSDKPFLGVLDFVGNSGRHELVTAVDIFGEGYEDEEIARAKELAEDGELGAQEALEESREELEQKRREAEQRRKDMEEKRRRQAMESARQGLVGTANYQVKVVNEWDAPPDGILEKHANVFRKAKVPIKDIIGMNDATRGELCRKIVMHWRMNLCTYRQAKCLQRAGWPREVLDRTTMQQATQCMDALVRSGWKLKYSEWVAENGPN
jgi:superfamily II DNA/RNA helicase